ncbi:MAG: anaerobic glycerol-3-phosphate dehydrogenase subunit GlpA [Desulfitobacterium hafniense]|nr:anaerobic glycerol-3-phosphate dehydrogenase subunit GlpA [Desulfitobacterium hafniense]
MIEYSAQVVIVGGGATGVGILRDLSMRGISALLLEQGDLAHGTSSRFHGLLHSGARYAVKDPVSAKECIDENLILKKIAPNCVVDTGGWFVHTEGDDPQYVTAWIEGCTKAGIPIREVSLDEARRLEPLLTQKAKRIFEVPDAAVDGFKLVWANAKSAQNYGGKFLTYHKVEGLLRNEDKVIGVTGKNITTGEDFVVHSEFVVNAAGAWAGQVASTIGVPLQVLCDKGTLLAFNQRLFQRVINRLRPASDGDIFVPHETITIFGTTSKLVDHPTENQSVESEINRLLDVGTELLPTIETHRVIRAFSGVRPLHQEEGDNSENDGREVSRTFAIIDHEEENNIQGFVSIVGGKFSTYRLMAEKVSEIVARKLGNSIPCLTAEERLLPEISGKLIEQAKEIMSCAVADKMLERLGDQAEEVLREISQNPRKGQMICECEMVTLAEVEKVIADDDTHNLADVRRKTRLGMGTCQGAFCTYRAISLLIDKGYRKDTLVVELKNFLNQRWKGIRPVLWGQQLRETELTRAIYAGLLDLKAEEGLTCGMGSSSAEVSRDLLREFAR